MISPELLDACEAAVRNAAEPLPLSKLAAKTLGVRSAKPKQREELRPAFQELASTGRIHEWPGTARDPKYWHRDAASAVREALHPLARATAGTAKSYQAALKGRLPKMTAALGARLIGEWLRRWAEAGELNRFAVNRSTVVYFPAGAAGASQDAWTAAILDGVRELEPGPHNYVPVRRLRESNAVKRVFDSAVLQLAESGRLAVGPFDGPTPIAEARRLDVVERGSEAYIAVARREDSSA